jgi:DNA polymerase-3 subunit beta
MKLSCLQENLKRGLAIAGHAVPGRSALPVLSNVLLAADDGRLKIAATNLEIGLTCWIGAKVEEEGSITVPARLLADVVGGLPNDKISLTREARTETLNLTCARFESNIKGIEADEFPSIPTILDREDSFSLPSELLREVADQVAGVAATDGSRPVLGGVLVRLKGTTATFAAADGFRLAVRVAGLAKAVATAREVVVPARAILQLARTLGDAETSVEMTITPKAGQILFHTENTELVARLIDGKFPDFERIITTQYATRTVLDTQKLAQAVKLASYFSASAANVVRMTITPGGDLSAGKLTIQTNAAEVGNNQGALDAQITGEGGHLALNVKFLAEAIGAIKTPQVALEIQTPQAPGVFRPVGAEGYLHVLMPMGAR